MSDERAALEDRIRSEAAAGRIASATKLAVEGFGDELLGFLVAMTRSEVDASDAFSLVCEQLWRSLPTFRWECTLRTFAYTLARQAIGRIRRDPHRRRAVPFEDAALSDAVAQVRTRTATFLRTETKDKIAELRAQLEPDDQSLLILRINRGLAWREIARVLAGDDELSEAELGKRSAALRKRFERLKDQLKAKARA